MRTHRDIDERSLALAEAVAKKIDRAPAAGLEKARETCRRWRQRAHLTVYDEWLQILEQPWSEVRRVLCEDSDRGRQLRQSNPFCGVLCPRERWTIYREFRSHAASRP